MGRMKIARVFPTRTSMSPVGQDSFFNIPGLFLPRYYGEVHISVTFTWDLEHAAFLKRQWDHIAKVKIGGPAINGEGEEFNPGMYLKKGITITSRGCPNKCSWCFIKKPLVELEVKPGNNIIDNNLLACSRSHLDKVFSMLKGEKKINFSGGLEASRVTEKIAERLRGLRLEQIYLAYDHKDNFNSVKKALEILKKYFSRRYLGCYVLIGFGKDTIDQAEGRLQEILDLGALPFAMLYRNVKGEYPEPEQAWRKFSRLWIRPALTRHKIKKGVIKSGKIHRRNYRDRLR